MGEMENQNNSASIDCGKTLYTADAEFVYGATAKDSCGCQVTVTDKYLVIRKVSKTEARSARLSVAGGLLGAVIADTVRSSLVRPQGYYAFSNIQKAIFPYRTNALKKNNAIKLINKDGTDFIIIFNKPGMYDGTAKVLKKSIEYIRAAIPVVEDGTNMNYGNAHCVKPFVTLDTLDKVKPGDAVAVHSAVYTAPAPQPTPAPQPAPQPQVVQPASQPAPQPQVVQPKPQSAPQSVVQTPLSEAVENMMKVADTALQCTYCGSIVPSGSIFCNKCGQKLEIKPQPKRCTQCGHLLEDGDKFCVKCGCKVQ